jgi:integrase
LRGKNGRAHAFYRYTFGSDRPLVSLGVLDADITLKGAREKAREYAALRREHPDLKTWLSIEAERQRLELEETRRCMEADARKGSLADLVQDYLDHLESQGKSSAKEVRRLLSKEIKGAQPAIAEMRACDIRPEHVRQILLPIWEQGARVLYNRARSYLRSAFAYGLHHEHDVARKGTTVFGLDFNPADALPRHPEVERARERALSAEELRTFYNGIDHVDSVGVMIATFLRFCIATGGQRPEQILRVPWKDYDLDNRTFRIEDRKGRAGVRIHLVPLTDRALGLLEQVRPISGGYEWPFSFNGTAPLHPDSLKTAVSRFLVSDQALVRGEPMQTFHPRDFRRSCKQLMLRANLAPHLADLLQNHAQAECVNGIETPVC